MKDYAKATAKDVRISPKKINLLAHLIRKTDVAEALDRLRFSQKSQNSLLVIKCLRSAIANAENNHNMNIEDLVVIEILVGPGTVLKRVNPKARGKGDRIRKTFSNLTIKLGKMEISSKKNKK